MSEKKHIGGCRRLRLTTGPSRYCAGRMLSLRSYIATELGLDDDSPEESLSEESSEPTKRPLLEWVVPSNLEKVRVVSSASADLFFQLLLFGFFICLDSFLFLFTLLPLRVLSGLWKMARNGWRKSRLPVHLDMLHFHISRALNRPTFRADLYRFLIFAVVLCCLFTMDLSTIYHTIRGQSALKYYFLFNAFDVLEKQCGSVLGLRVRLRDQHACMSLFSCRSFEQEHLDKAFALLARTRLVRWHAVPPRRSHTRRRSTSSPSPPPPLSPATPSTARAPSARANSARPPLRDCPHKSVTFAMASSSTISPSHLRGNATSPPPSPVPFAHLPTSDTQRLGVSHSRSSRGSPLSGEEEPCFRSRSPWPHDAPLMERRCSADAFHGACSQTNDRAVAQHASGTEGPSYDYDDRLHDQRRHPSPVLIPALPSSASPSPVPAPPACFHPIPSPTTSPPPPPSPSPLFRVRQHHSPSASRVMPLRGPSTMSTGSGCVSPTTEVAPPPDLIGPAATSVLSASDGPLAPFSLGGTTVNTLLVVEPVAVTDKAFNTLTCSAALKLPNAQPPANLVSTGSADQAAPVGQGAPLSGAPMTRAPTSRLPQCCQVQLDSVDRERATSATGRCPQQLKHQQRHTSSTPIPTPTALVPQPHGSSDEVRDLSKDSAGSPSIEARHRISTGSLILSAGMGILYSGPHISSYPLTLHFALPLAIVSVLVFSNLSLPATYHSRR